jgi:hypothetical protein
MENEKKLTYLLEYIDESLRRKLFCKEFFDFFLILIEELLRRKLLEFNRFIDIFRAAKDLLWNVFMKGKEFRKKFEEFLMINPEIDELMQKYDMDASIILTDLAYQFECFDQLDSPFQEKNLNVNEFKRDLENHIEQVTSEFKAISLFRNSLLDYIRSQEKCYKCDRIALYKCNKCSLNLCKKHQISNYCRKCAESLLNKNE